MKKTSEKLNFDINIKETWKILQVGSNPSLLMEKERDESVSWKMRCVLRMEREAIYRQKLL